MKSSMIFHKGGLWEALPYDGPGAESDSFIP